MTDRRPFVEHAFAARWSVRSDVLYWTLGTQNIHAGGLPEHENGGPA